MNANTLGTIGALVAFAGTILAMSSGTKLVGIVLLGTALTMGVVGLAQVRSEPRRQHHPTPGRAPRLAVVLALVGIGVGLVYMLVAKPYLRSEATSGDAIPTKEER